ncbi:MAG: hypothetical protein IPH04_14150 [Saprospirales bacterium]|nr:hypothetical protein [Saprospirales bacterium]
MVEEARNIPEGIRSLVEVHVIIHLQIHPEAGVEEAPFARLFGLGMVGEVGPSAVSQVSASSGIQSRSR